MTDEGMQAAVYGELLRRAACDPAMAQVNIFGFRDDAARTGFQAGLNRADGTRARRPTPSAPRSPARAARGRRAWRPARSSWREAAGREDHAQADQRRPHGGRGRVRRVCLLPGAHTLSSARRVLAGRSAGAGCTTMVVTQNRWTSVRFPRLPGRQTVAVQLAAETNPARSTTIVRPVP